MSVDVKESRNFVAGAKWKGYDIGPSVNPGRQIIGGVRTLVIPGRIGASVIVLAGVGNDLLVYDLIVVDYPVTLDGIYLEVTAVGSAGSGIKMGLTAMDVDWQPTGARLWHNNASPIALDTLGVKSVTGLGLALAPGRYALVWSNSSTNGTHALRTVATDMLNGILPTSWNANAITLVWRAAGSPWYAGGIPDPIPAPDTTSTSAFGFSSMFFYDLSAA